MARRPDLADMVMPRLLAAAPQDGRPVIVGIAGPQGAGKSALACALSDRLALFQVRTATLSLDDLYLTRDERLRLGAEVHPLLAVRGPPGTHDTDLGLATLDALTTRGAVRPPRFDKALDDRRPSTASDEVSAPVGVVFFEGWCLGASPQPAQALAAPINALERDADPQAIWRTYVNDALAGSYQALFARIDFLIRVEAPSFEVVVDWRRQQEHALAARLRRDGEPGRSMSDDEVAGFCQYFERLTRHMSAGGTRPPDMRVALDAERRPRIKSR